MATVEEVIMKLNAHARPDQVEGMSRYGMTSEKRLGVAVPDMRKIAKEVGRSHILAVELWKTGIPEARIVAALVGEKDKLTEKQMEEWVQGINSWDVCDQVCMNLFEKSPLAWKKILDWSGREEEFVKRTAFSLLACIAWHDKEAEDEKFIDVFPVIKKGAADNRNFVKKAVSWALRNIGKRNKKLNKAAIKTAEEILQTGSKSARWIASDVIRELQSGQVRKRLMK